MSRPMAPPVRWPPTPAEYAERVQRHMLGDAEYSAEELISLGTSIAGAYTEHVKRLIQHEEKGNGQ